MRAFIELHRICPCYIALYSGDLSLVAIDIMEASIVLYGIIIATIAKSVFPDGCILLQQVLQYMLRGCIYCCNTMLRGWKTDAISVSIPALL